MNFSRRALFKGLGLAWLGSKLNVPIQAIKRRFSVAYVGKGPQSTHSTISEAFRDIEPGGTIYVLPGVCEVHSPITLGPYAQAFVRANGGPVEPQ